MRESLLCPKCRQRKIWHIEEVRHNNTYAGGARLPVIYQRQIGPVETGFFSEGQRSTVTLGHYDVFICAACGYAEWYAQGFEGMEECPEEGVRLLDGESRGGAYR